MLPNFIGVGAPKSGTTTLDFVLKKHPEIYLPACKETHFFDTKNVHVPNSFVYSKYEGNFFAAANHKAVGEICPSYLFDKNAPKKILEHLGPDMKIIFCLRNPVERAYSDYLMHYNNLLTNSSTFEAQLSIIAEKFELQETNFNPLYASLYAKHIENYLSYFSKKNMFFIVMETDLAENAPMTFKKLFKFLGVNPDVEINSNVKIHENKNSKFEYFEDGLANNETILTELNKQKSPSPNLLQKLLKSFSTSSKPKSHQIESKPTIPKNALGITLRHTARKTVVNPSAQLLAESHTFKVPPKLTKEYKKQIYDQHFADDVQKLEKIIDRDLSFWDKW